jgi:hypothetical protein
MCAECQKPALGSIFCAEHAPAPPPPPPASPYTAPFPAPVKSSASPILALILGFAPGVGAIYNGQYAKGLIHAVIFGLLVSIENSLERSGRHTGLEALVGIMIAAWVFYQAFEAYHTARQRRYGHTVEEFSSLIEVRTAHGRFPAAAILLIGLGFVLLLDTTGIVSLERFARFWPALLIFLGLYLLYARTHAVPENSAAAAVPSDREIRSGSFRQ